MSERNPGGAGPDILAVIVLYRRPPGESAAFTTLTSDLLPHDSRTQVLLFDNTPGARLMEELPEHVLYHPAAHNEGIAGAYSYALDFAISHGFSWLLTLDQDACLPPHFLARMREIALRLDGREEIAAIAPQLSHAGRLLSPHRIRPWGMTYLPRRFEGVAPGEIHALNSASLFRVSALATIGGFDPRFWLDYQDHYIFRQLHRHEMQVWAAGSIQVKHDLSLLSDEQSPMSDRFRNFLQAESAFCDLYGGPLGGLALTGRLACRLLRQRRRGVDAAARQLTRRALWRRLLLTRARRIRDWQKEMRQRMARNPQPDNRKRPSVSVCMAAFRGERYIARQLQSILDQLSDYDEVIVVDDASGDRTCEIVEGFRDPRIRLIRHTSNLGVLRTFEDAIRDARGELLFLADQDDLWAPEKVSRMLDAFAIHPEAEIFVSDAALIDDNDDPIGDSYYALRGPFRPGILANLLRCRYLGCTMAFRSSIRSRILPFPADADVLHDLWIGAVNALAGGSSVYLDSPLVLYRRHHANATGIRRLPLSRQIRIRWDLCRSLARSWSRWHRGTAR